MKHARLAAEPRIVIGKKVAQLRRDGKLPANIYGHNVDSTSVTLDAHDFGLLYRHLLPTTVIDLEVGGQTRPVLLAKATTHPKSGSIIHVEFKQVNMRERVHSSVEVIGVGQSDLLARQEAILLQSADTVTISALPDDLPASIQVDLSVLTSFESAIHAGDLPFDHSKIELLTPRDELIFKLALPQGRDAAAAETDTEAATTETEA